mmetsp:Transcript_12508/g.35642  ORF Transcript_12508/g.35642 Transcript_12508/m.35642 type:complete len:530 (+) Transcript_12508:80-1669(+)
MICGKDLDEVFAYQTPKVVILKDRRLGFIAISLKLLIFCYIFLWMIIYQGKHLSVADVNGVNRLSVRNPSEDMCNPFHVGCRSNYTDFRQLPYCAESAETYNEGDGTKRPCQIWDSVEAHIPFDDGALVPTRVRRYDQVRACEPSEENNWSCNPAPYEYLSVNGSQQTVHGEAVPKYDAFIADIEHFTVLIDHNFRRYGGLMEDDSSMNGQYFECPSVSSRSWDCPLRHIPCVHDDCPAGSVTPDSEPQREPRESLLVWALRGRRRLRSSQRSASASHGVLALGEAGTASRLGAAEDYARLANEILVHSSGVAVAVPKGDVFTLGSLLRLANQKLDARGDYSTSFRTRGLVLVIHIQYDNRPEGGFLGLRVTPWRTPPSYYTYRVMTRKAADFRQTKTFDDPAATRRTIRIYNGVRVVVEQSGSIAMWDTPFFLMTMTTALGLMALANTLTDLLLMYFLPQSEEYKKRKFYTSKDFNPDDEEGEQGANRKPATKQEAGSRFLEALEAQDAEAVADALPQLLEFCDKKDA